MSKRGDDFMKQAEKKLKGFSLFNKSGKFADAADLFMKAGNSYKSIRAWDKAGDAYFQASECFMNCDSLNESASAAADAGKMFGKQPETREKAIESFRKAVQVYRENSKPTQAARLLVDAAKLFQENEDYEGAVATLMDAAQLYDDENQPMQAATQLTQVADIKSLQKQWVEAAKLYKDVAMRRMSDRLTQLAAGEFFTKAVICQLAADDIVGGQNMCTDFCNSSPGWERSRECIMLQAIMNAINDRDPDAMSQAIYDYDQIKRLDKWMTDSLLEIKKLIEGDPDDIC